jgi:hypothetical protein
MTAAWDFKQIVFFGVADDINNSQRQPGAARGSYEQPEAVRSSQQQPRAGQEQPGTAMEAENQHRARTWAP